MAAYATRAELYQLGIRQEALEDLDDPTKDAALEAASRKLDGYFASYFTVPLDGTIPSDVKEAVCKLAAYELLCGPRGINPEAHQNVRDRYDDAIDWLKGVSAGRIRPQVQPLAAAGEPLADPVVESLEPRGW